MSSVDSEVTVKPSLKRRKVTNFPMIILLVAVIVFGLVTLYSVSGPAGYASESRSTVFYLRKQIQYTLAGFVLLAILNYIPVNLFKKNIIWGSMFAICPGIIALTAVAGYELNGAKRWIKLGSTTFQTSELVKVAIVIGLAGYWNWHFERRKAGKTKTYEKKSRQLLHDAFWDFILPIGGAVLTDVLILVQPHLSCAIIVAFIVFMCAVSAGINIRSWIVGGACMLAAGLVIIGIVFLSNPAKVTSYIENNFAHVFKRAEIFATTQDQEAETTLTEDDTRQVTNAHNALGSGGFWGRGIGNSRAKYSYVSEAQNDYIFSILVEETGFVGGTFLILLYLSMIAMCVMVILRTDSMFARVVSVGCTSLIMIEAILNIAVELQVIPSTGVTLPFVSYGGTAQVFLMIAYGMILCVSRSGTKSTSAKELTDGV